MEIESTIHHLAERLGIPGLALDADGACAFLIDDDIHAELRYDQRADVLCLYASVGRALPSELPEVLGALLEANGEPDLLNGGHFTLAPQDEEIVLCRTFDWDGVPIDHLMDELAGLVQESREWRGRFADRRLIAH